MNAPATRAAARGVATALFLLGPASGAGAADGAALFKSHCALCHGNVAAPKFTGRSAAEVGKAIAEGKGKMRPVAIAATDAAEIASFAADQPSSPGLVTPGPNPVARQKVARGDDLVAAKDNQLALYAYLDGVNLDPRNVEARLKLAAHYARMGYPDRARDQWEIAAALDPGNAEAARNSKSSGGGRQP
jgi:cytochrome c5